ncbi:hypothetical protein ABTP10_19755, partial [Acinetobacter baumannii]
MRPDDLESRQYGNMVTVGLAAVVLSVIAGTLYGSTKQLVFAPRGPLYGCEQPIGEEGVKDDYWR